MIIEKDRRDDHPLDRLYRLGNQPIIDILENNLRSGRCKDQCDKCLSEIRFTKLSDLYMTNRRFYHWICPVCGEDNQTILSRAFGLPFMNEDQPFRQLVPDLYLIRDQLSEKVIWNVMQHGKPIPSPIRKTIESGSSASIFLLCCAVLFLLVGAYLMVVR